MALALALASREPQADSRLKHASRHAEQNGWIWVHLEGSPADIGYQHGYLLAPEIRDTLETVSLEMSHDEKKDWQFFRDKAQNMLWPHVEAEYRAELQGIADGAVAHGVKLDLWDVVALNAWLEMPYFDKWDARAARLSRGTAFRLSRPEHCSAFVATGSYTKDGRVVIAHNNWTSYETGERWNIIFDVVPEKGNHFLMDGMAGLIHSGDDFGMNSAGIMITETTISRFTRVRSQRHSGIRARAQSHAIFRIHRRFRAHHEGGQQRRLRQQLAGGGPQDQRDRQPGVGPEERDAAAHPGRLLRRLQLPCGRETDARRDRIRPEESERQRQRAPRALAATDGAEQGQDRRRARPSVFWPTISTRTRTKWIPTSVRCAATSTIRRAARCRGRGLTRPWARCNPKSRMPPWPKR